MRSDGRRTAELAAIHVAKRQLGLDDGTYREMLLDLTGYDSAGSLDSAGRQKVIEHLRRHGFRRTMPREQGGAPVAELRDAQHRMARGLWIELHKHGVVRDGSEKALNHFTKRVTGVEALGWTDASQANQVIEALKAMARRPRT